jgi:uncharacterized membrane protein
MKAGIALLALGVPLVTPAGSAAAGHCLQHPLASLAGVSSLNPSAVAPAGRFVVGTGELASGQRTVVRWHDGVPKQLGVVADGVVVGDVSDDGQIVIGVANGPRVKNYRYRDGELEGLPTPSGYVNVVASDIDNANGLIAGTVYDADFRNGRGVVWDAANRPRVLQIPPGFNEIGVNDIDNNGMVVGLVADWDYENATVRSQRPAYWESDGAVTLLPETAYPEVIAVRDGVAVGVNGDDAVRWQLGTGAPGTTIARTRASALNGKGAVLLAKSVLTADQGERPLEMKDPGGASGVFPIGIDDRNQVYGVDGHTFEAVRWDCG